MVVYADVGTGFNQLLDLVVLTALAVGHLAGRAATARDARTAPVIAAGRVVSVIWAAALGLVRTVGFDLRRAVAASDRRRPATRAAIMVGQHGPTARSGIGGGPVDLRRACVASRWSWTHSC